MGGSPATFCEIYEPDSLCGSSGAGQGLSEAGRIQSFFCGDPAGRRERIRQGESRGAVSAEATQGQGQVAREARPSRMVSRRERTFLEGLQNR